MSRGRTPHRRVSGVHIYLSKRSAEISYSFPGGAMSNKDIAARPESEKDIATGAMRNTIFSTGTESEEDIEGASKSERINRAYSKLRRICPEGGPHTGASVGSIFIYPNEVRRYHIPFRVGREVICISRLGLKARMILRPGR